MSADVAIWMIVAFMFVIGGGIIALIGDRADDDPLDIPASAREPRIQHREAAPREVRLIYTHAAPGRPFTVPAARVVMRDHLECTLADCPRKREAHATLVKAGVLVPRGTAHAARWRAHV